MSQATNRPARSIVLAALVLAASACGPGEPALPPVLPVASFEEPVGVGTPWGGGSVRKEFPTDGLQSYKVVLQGPENMLLARAGALPPQTLSYRKLLIDVRNPTAPAPVYLILAGPSRERSAIYEQVWVPFGASTIEFDLERARSKGIAPGDPIGIQLGLEKPDGRPVELFFDNVRLSIAGAPPPPPPPSPAAGVGLTPESLLPNPGFEDGWTGWRPWTFAGSAAAFAFIGAPHASRGSVSAGIFHRARGPAGLQVRRMDLPPGRYRLCGSIRADEPVDVRVERLEIRPAGQSEAEVWAPVRVLKAGKEWEEAGVEIELPPDPKGSPDAFVDLDIRLGFDKGDLFLDDLSLLPLPATEGGPATRPVPAAPPDPRFLGSLSFGAALRADGPVHALAGDLSPALLGGGIIDGMLRVAAPARGHVRLFLVGATSASSSFHESGSVLGITPGAVRGARAANAGAGGPPLFTVVRTDHQGELENFLDAADGICGGLPLGEVKRGEGLEDYARSLDAVARAAAAGSTGGAAGSSGPGRRPALAWVDCRTLPGRPPADPEELRAMVLLAIAAGLDGAVLAPFAEVTDAGGFPAEVERIAGELTALGPIEEIRAIETGDRRVRAALGRAGGSRFLVMVNVGKSPVEKIALTLPREAGGSRTVSLKGLEGRIERVEPDRR
jgi:hypothetical protein